MSRANPSHPPFQTNDSHSSDATFFSEHVDETGQKIANIVPQGRRNSGADSLPPGATTTQMPAVAYHPNLTRPSVARNNDERNDITPPGSPSQRLLDTDPNHVQYATYQDEKRGQYVPEAAEDIHEEGWLPLPLRPWFWISLVVILAGSAVGLEIALFFSNKNQGWATNRDIGKETGILHYVYTLPPVAVVAIFVAMWAWTDIEIKKMQPYVDLVHGDSPPHRSLLLDYTRTNNFFVWTRAATNKHYLVALASLMVVLSLAFQPLAASLLVVKDTWLPQPAVTKQTLAAVGFNQNLQFNDLTSFLTAAGYAAATVLYNLTSAPFINGPYTVAPFQLPIEIANNGTASANTTAVKSDPGCRNAPVQMLKRPDGSGWNNSATLEDCSFTWSVDKNATTLFGTDIANCTQGQAMWFEPVIFWIFTYSPSPMASATFCYPSLSVWDVSVGVDLASGNISSPVTELRSFSSSSNYSQFSDSVTGPPLNGQALNGIKFNISDNSDRFVQARQAAVQLQLPAAIYQAALSIPGGLVEAFNPQADHFVQLSSKVYSLYLTLIAKEVYFLPASDPITVQVKTFKKRVWLSDTAVHLLAVAMLMLAFFATIIHLFHRFDRRNLRLKHEPGTIASAVSIGAQTGVGTVLAGRQGTKDISAALQNKKFRIDPQTMKIVMEGETGYENATSPVERRRSVFGSLQGQVNIRKASDMPPKSSRFRLEQGPSV